MTGYVRQSISEILPGEEIKADPLNQEFNALSTAFNAASGHAHDGTSGSGPKINLTSSVLGNLPATNLAADSIPYNKLEDVANNKVLGNTTGVEAAVNLVDILDEDTMVSNRANAIPTQQSVKAYVDALDTAVVDALDALTDAINIELGEIGDEIDDIQTDITAIETDITTLETAISNIKIRDLLYENTSFTLSSASNLSVTGILDKYRAFEIECDITGLNSNAGGTVALVLSVGDGTNWYEFGVTNQRYLVNWTNNSTGARGFVATVSCIDDLNLPIVMTSVHNSITPPEISSAMSVPGTLSTRPVSALRFRVIPTSGTVVASINKLRIWGLLK